MLRELLIEQFAKGITRTKDKALGMLLGMLLGTNPQRRVRDGDERVLARIGLHWNEFFFSLER